MTWGNADRTLTIGQRTSGKYCRFYEKGKKEGDASSPWCRAEVEYKSKDRVIPFDALLDPSAYFVAAYPCFSQFAAVDTVKPIEVKKKLAKVTWEHALRVTKEQFGKYINVFRQYYGDDKAVLDLIVCNDPNAWPKRLLAVSASLDTCPEPIHRQVFSKAIDPLTAALLADADNGLQAT